MKYILLLLIACCLSVTAYCQDTTDTRRVTTALAKGLEAIEKLKKCDSMLFLRNVKIEAQENIIEAQGDKIKDLRQLHLATDSLYRASNIESNELLQDNARLKKGKKTWIIVSAIGFLGSAIAIFK